MNLEKINKELKKRFNGAIKAENKDGCTVLTGRLSSWQDVVTACSLASKKYSTTHVVNDIVCDEIKPQSPRLPKLCDSALDGEKPDVLIIGGGISGVSIARELSRWKLDILLVEKEADIALQASGRNDGEVHPGIDLSKGSKKHFYIRKGNEMYTKICEELKGEKIDVVKYSDDPKEFIKQALKPAAVISVDIPDETVKACSVVVPDNQLSLAIGNKGQNAKLAARLTGYKIDIKPESGFFEG